MMIVSSPAPALNTSVPPLPVKISSPKPATSYVIFGKTNTEAVNLANISKGENTAAHAIDFQGDTNTDKNDTLTGTSADVAPANFRVSVLPPPSTRASK
jgi:hypothetical protein